MRHFHIINLPTVSEEILTDIFETIINKFLDSHIFSDDVIKCENITVTATIDMFTQFNKNMLPIPSRFHY
jgi:dynein heavy chain